MPFHFVSLIFCSHCYVEGFYTWMANCYFLQFLLLYLGREKRMCSLMRKVSLYVHLPDQKTTKFLLIWYTCMTGWFLSKSSAENLNIRKCLNGKLLFCWVYYTYESFLKIVTVQLLVYLMYICFQQKHRTYNDLSDYNFCSHTYYSGASL